jgi:enamine deaminase RidA (YjgF/YER057c/UK114 family)
MGPGAHDAGQDCDYLLSPGVRVGDIIFISGMTPRDDEGKMLEGTIEELTE